MAQIDKEKTTSNIADDTGGGSPPVRLAADTGSGSPPVRLAARKKGGKKAGTKRKVRRQKKK
jgi:hypothetical protein